MNNNDTATVTPFLPAQQNALARAFANGDIVTYRNALRRIKELSPAEVRPAWVAAINSVPRNKVNPFPGLRDTAPAYVIAYAERTR